MQSILGPDEAIFCIEDIQKSNNDYIITAYMLKNSPRIISKADYETLENGGEITFRNQKWKMSGSEFIQSGEDLLSICYNSDTEQGFLENIAGIATRGLKDYSGEKIKFKVASTVLIGDFWWRFKYNNNGKFVPYDITSDEIIENPTGISFDRLLELSKGCKGSYDECIAYIKNGVVGALKVYEK